MYAYIERRSSQLMGYLESRIASLARFTEISKSSATGETDQVAGQKALNEQPVGDDVRRLGSGGWGIAAVPPAGEPALVVRAGGGPLNGVVVACGSKRYMPAGMADGDVSLYSKQSGVTVYLKASDGSITLTDKAGSSITLDGTSGITIQPTGTVAKTVLVLGAVDSMGVPVTNILPVFTKAG